MNPSVQHVLNLLVENPDRSIRSMALKSGVSRRHVARKKHEFAAILAKERGEKVSLSEAAKAVVVAHYTHRKRARPDFEAVDEALDQGDSMRAIHRRYRAENGKNALCFSQFAHVCRAQRGGTSLKCVRRSHVNPPPPPPPRHKTPDTVPPQLPGNSPKWPAHKPRDEKGVRQ